MQTDFRAVMLSFGEFLPLLAYLGVQLSGIPTILTIIRNKCIAKKDNPYLFLMLVINGFVWCLYAILIEDKVILISNGSGVALGIIYSSIFYQYSNATQKQVMQKYISIVILLISLFFFGTYLQFMIDIHLGFLGSVCAIILMSSPLSMMRAVIRDRTSIYLPIPTVITTFFNALSWLLYGVILKDPFVWFPNGVGLLASIVQLCLLFAYPRDVFHFDDDKPSVAEVGQLL